MGFHPDFTGRQNVYMSGLMMGLGREEIERLMPEIEAFADIGDYIEEPVRIYSSGMQMRLAFAVATASRPDILIVDEALSVGDSVFRRNAMLASRTSKSRGPRCCWFPTAPGISSSTATAPFSSKMVTSAWTAPPAT